MRADLLTTVASADCGISLCDGTDVEPVTLDTIANKMDKESWFVDEDAVWTSCIVVIDITDCEVRNESGVGVDTTG
jgi:hypothetical protein